MKQLPWEIRTAQAADIPAMLELWKDIKEVQSRISDSIETVQGFLTLNPTSFLVACSGETLIGTIMGGYNGWRGSIYHLAINPYYRGQGIGKALMVECLEALYKRGAPRVDLTTYAFNKNAQGFYLQMGFTERTDIKNFSFEYHQDKKRPGTLE